VAGFYRTGALLDAATPAGAAAPTAALTVTPKKAGHGTIRIGWQVDGRPVPAPGDGTRLDVRTLRLAPGAHRVTVTVTDTTPWVRDPALRRTLLTATRSWAIRR
jgi:hypothetical protein